MQLVPPVLQVCQALQDQLVLPEYLESLLE